MSHQVWRVVAQNKEKAVRIVSTGRQGRNPLWVSVEDEKPKSPDSGTVVRTTTTSLLESVWVFSSMKTFSFLLCMYSFYIGDPSAAKSCVSLMPYSLVTPHYPPVCRPVLLLPTVLGRILDKKLAGWQGFQLCEPGEDCCVVLR